MKKNNEQKEYEQKMIDWNNYIEERNGCIKTYYMQQTLCDISTLIFSTIFIYLFCQEQTILAKVSLTFFVLSILFCILSFFVSAKLFEKNIRVIDAAYQNKPDSYIIKEIPASEIMNRTYLIFFSIGVLFLVLHILFGL